MAGCDMGQTDEVHVRPATDSDLPAVGRVHALARARAYVDLVPAEALARVTPERQERVWRERVAATRARSAMLVAERNDEVVGFTFGVDADDGDDGDEVPQLNALHVLPAHHGTGIGHALHEALLAEIHGWGHDEVELWVLRGNEPAQAFYRRHGWTHDGTTGKHEVGGIVVPILRYRRSLP